jgi:hypothetical protein
MEEATESLTLNGGESNAKSVFHLHTAELELGFSYTQDGMEGSFLSLDEMIDMIGDSTMGVRTRKALRGLRKKVAQRDPPLRKPDSHIIRGAYRRVEANTSLPEAVRRYEAAALVGSYRHILKPNVEVLLSAASAGNMFSLILYAGILVGFEWDTEMCIMGTPLDVLSTCVSKVARAKVEIAKEILMHPHAVLGSGSGYRDLPQFESKQKRLDFAFQMLSLGVNLLTFQWMSTVESMDFSEVVAVAEELVEACVLGRDNHLVISHRWRSVSDQPWLTPMLTRVAYEQGRLKGPLHERLKALMNEESACLKKKIDSI